MQGQCSVTVVCEQNGLARRAQNFIVTRFHRTCTGKGWKQALNWKFGTDGNRWTVPAETDKLSKLPRILGMHRLNYVFFLVFGVIWFVTRVYLYQFRFLYSLYVDFGHRAYLGLYLFWIICLNIAMLTTIWSIKIIAVVLAPLSFSKNIEEVLLGLSL